MAISKWHGKVKAFLENTNRMSRDDGRRKFVPRLHDHLRQGQPFPPQMALTLENLVVGGRKIKLGPTPEYPESDNQVHTKLSPLQRTKTKPLRSLFVVNVVNASYIVADL